MSNQDVIKIAQTRRPAVREMQKKYPFKENYFEQTTKNFQLTTILECKNEYLIHL